MKCDGTRAETRFRLSAKRTSPFKSAGASVQSTTGRRGVRINGSNAGYTMFRVSVKGLATHSIRVSPPPPRRVTLCHHVSNGEYLISNNYKNSAQIVQYFYQSIPVFIGIQTSTSKQLSSVPVVSKLQYSTYEVKVKQPR